MSNFKKVARVEDLNRHTGTTVQLDDKEIALFHVDGAVYATDNLCVHRGGPLGEGTVEEKLVTCPWHGWQYDLTTGCSPHNPTVKVNCYTVKVENGDVLVST